MLGRFIHSLSRRFPYRNAKLRDLFDTLELEVVLNCLLNFTIEAFEIENVIWMRADECLLWMDQAHGIAPVEGDQLVQRQIRYNPVNLIDEGDVRKRLWFFHSKTTRPEANVYEGKLDILYPILGRDQKPLGYLFLIGGRPYFKTGIMRQMNWLVSRVARHLQFSMEMWAAKNESMCDDLTGLYNQKFLGHVLENEIGRSTRNDSKFTVLFLDVDHFKIINDTKGHWIGSKVLIELGQVIRSQLRRNDYAFRYGGDEFVMVLPETGADGGRVAAERVRETIANTDFLIDGVRLKLTVSVGLAAFPEHAKTHREIIRMADEAMYCGKNKSRNVVFVANS